jgi:hypothetical protein
MNLTVATIKPQRLDEERQAAATSGDLSAISQHQDHDQPHEP